MTSVFRWLGQGWILFPSFIFELDVLERHRRPAGVEIGKSLILRDPAAVDDVTVNWLPFLVEQLDPNLAPKFLQRLGGMTLVQHLSRIGPVLKVAVVRDPALERDRVILRAAQAF